MDIPKIIKEKGLSIGCLFISPASLERFEVDTLEKLYELINKAPLSDHGKLNLTMLVEHLHVQEATGSDNPTDQQMHEFYPHYTVAPF